VSHERLPRQKAALPFQKLTANRDNVAMTFLVRLAHHLARLQILKVGRREIKRVRMTAAEKSVIARACRRELARGQIESRVRVAGIRVRHGTGSGPALRRASAVVDEDLPVSALSDPVVARLSACRESRATSGYRYHLQELSASHVCLPVRYKHRIELLDEDLD
jgi:hypothetical protein